MSTKYKASNNNVYFVTITTVDWVDIFTRLNHKKTIIDSLNYCREKKGLNIYGYTLMHSHLHMICSAKNGFELSDIIRDFKKHTSKQIVENIKKEPESRREWLLELFSKACENLKKKQEYKVWQDGYHAEEVLTKKFFDQKLNYIHTNPVKDQVVVKPEDYLFSSARNYAELDALMEIDLIPHQLKTYV
ncbi:MAG: transposase [Bacteroidetes bacterium]|nr:transposase [Bacteroidota bacterium]